jgi:tetratricopeptide (TPR) repeat protein
MQSIYPPQVLEDVNRRIDIRKMMHSINYKFDKYQDSGKMGKGYCPIHCEGLFRNLIIDKDQRTFRCLYTQCPGAKGGTLIELFAQAKKLELDDAVRALVKEQGLQVSLPVNAEVVEQSLEQAEAHLAANETEPAEAIYQRLLEAQPQLEAAHRGLMKVYATTGDSERRFQHLATLLQLRGGGAELAEFSDDIAAWADAQPDNQQARLALAELTLTQSEDPEEAIMEFMAAADACEAVGNIEGAIRAYSRVEQLSQERHIDIIDATPHIVRVYEQAGRHQEALAHLLKKISDAEQHEDFRRAAELLISALEQEPDNVELRARFVEAAKKTPTTPARTEKILETVEFFSGRDDAESGIKALEGYVATAPDDERALLKLIDQYHTHGKPTEAGDTEARLARRHFAQGRRDEAIERVNAVLQWQPEHVESLRALAEFQASTEQGSAARETRRRMAKALTGQRKFAEATEVLDSLIAEQPEATELLDQLAANLELAAKAGDAAAGSRAVSILEQLADQQIASTSGRTSLQYLERATALESTNPALLLKLASAALRSGNRTAARDSVILACEALAGDGKLKEAIAEAEQFTRVMPDEVDLQRYLAELHVRSGDKASAVKRLRRLADDLAARGRHNDAKEVFDQAQALMPENADTLLAQAELLEKAGNKEQLAATLSRAATMQEQAGDLEGAINTLQRVIANKSEDTAAAARIVQA